MITSGEIGCILSFLVIGSLRTLVKTRSKWPLVVRCDKEKTLFLLPRPWGEGTHPIKCITHCYVKPRLAWNVKDVIRKHLKLYATCCFLNGTSMWDRFGSAWAKFVILKWFCWQDRRHGDLFLITCMCPGSDALGKQFNWVNGILTLRTHSNPDILLCDVRPVNNLILIPPFCYHLSPYTYRIYKETVRGAQNRHIFANFLLVSEIITKN